MFIRKKIWKILIGNPSGLTVNMYSQLKKEFTTKINFEELEKQYEEKSTVTIKGINNNKITNLNINQIAIDIIKIKYLFLPDILELKYDPKTIMLKVFNITCSFFLFRKDIPYNMNLISLIFVFLLIGQDEENSFLDTFNLICSNDTVNIFLAVKEIIKPKIKFFNNIIKKYTPKIEEHFNQLEITTELYLIPWLEDLFTKCLDLKILLHVLDMYILNGEYVLYQTGLTIIKLLEDDLLSLTISDVFKILKRLPNKYDTISFFNQYKCYAGVKEEFIAWKKETNFGNQKALLLADVYSE